MSSISCHPESSTLFKLAWCFKFERKVASETERDKLAEAFVLCPESLNPLRVRRGRVPSQRHSRMAFMTSLEDLTSRRFGREPCGSRLGPEKLPM